MFLACGVGAWGIAIFHVFTHAFFKAQLFLGSGSVINGMHHEQDMRKMGGLRKYMPITFWTMMAGLLAISGFPLFSGFFSKDGILFSTFVTKALPDPWGKILWGVGAFTALLTAVYMTRLMVLTFFGEERFKKQPDTISSHSTAHDDGHHAITPHESPLSMTLPLIVLAIGALAVGWFGIPKGLGGGDNFVKFLQPSTAAVPEFAWRTATGNTVPNAEIVRPASTTEPLNNKTESEGEGKEELTLTIVSSLIALIGLGLGYFWFTSRPLWQPPSILENKYYVDEIYDATVVNPIKFLSATVLWRFVDVMIIDGLVNGVGNVVKDMGSTLRMIQTGATRVYAAIIAVGGLAVIGYFAYQIISNGGGH